jgi:hypothetical protein
MCQFRNCKTKTKASGFCIVCGEEVCPDCASKEDPKKHASCTRDYGFGGGVDGGTIGDEAPAPW